MGSLEIYYIYRIFTALLLQWHQCVSVGLPIVRCEPYACDFEVHK